MKTLRKSVQIFAALVAAAVISGCASSTTITKGEAFPKMYEEQPKSLLILPPMNDSADAEAKAYYMTTIEQPMAQMGYYVFPVEMVSDIMKQQGVYDTELLYSTPLDKFYEYFGADAVLFTRIVRWDVSYMVMSSTLTVTIESEIRSTKTSEELWKYRGSVTVDLTGTSSSGDLLVDLVAQAIATAINTAAADYVTYAHQANERLMYSIPVGPYHPLYLQDQDVKIMNQAAKAEAQ